MPSLENTILDEIYTLIDGLASVQEVYKEDTNAFSGYPAVVVFLRETTSDPLTTNQDQVKFIYTIRIHQEMKERGNAEADRIIRDIMGDLRVLFQANYSLNGSVNFLDPIPQVGGYQVREVGTVRVAELTLTANKLICV